ncbi:MAG: YjjG family noncanonical pyrimidine nucleotidase [Bacteroidales bacterium]|nr:YjjG family noncanonical pyrimidine nucleotidase [Bacteroidales bacterium]
MTKYQHIFFDLDNTLWDFDKSSILAFDKIYEIFNLINYGIPNAKDFHKTYFDHNNRLWEQYRQGKIDKEFLKTERFRLPLNDYGIVNEKLAIDLGESYTDLAARLVALVPNTMETLTYLKEKNYKIHLITNGFLEVQSIKMQASGLDMMIDYSFVSEVVGFKKPDHRIFHHAINEVGGSIENSVMIGDDLSVDIIPAKEIGMTHIYFNRKKISHNEKLDYEIYDLIEICDII